MNKNFEFAKKKQRESAKEQGFYDGRFKTKMVPVKKKDKYKKKFDIDSEE